MMESPRSARVGPETLLAVDLFRDLSPADRAAIAKRCEAAQFRAGERIVMQRGDETDVFFIVSGTVRVTFHSKPGKDVQFRDQHAGECFGELAAIDGRPRSADVEALSDVFVGAIKSRDFLDIATRYPPVGAKIFVQLASRIRSLSDRVIELSTLGVNNRIHAELLRLARQHGVEGNRAEIRPAPTHADMASRVSTHREAVTKELGVLVKNGLVERTRGVLRVIDVERLEAIVQNVADV
jgi:CRP/FNR family transcriptional regulator, cyclic AMP receptor protein